MNTGAKNLSAFDRLSRLALGYALIGIAYFHGGFLGLLALLPLVAIYPMMTAAVGFCPVEGTIKRGFSPVSASSRAPIVARSSRHAARV
jgi:hypothetical protein